MRATKSVGTVCITNRHGKQDTSQGGTVITGRQMHTDAAPSTMTEKNARTLKVRGRKMEITASEAKAMLQAKLECMKQKDLKCIGEGCDGDCDNCHLNYEQGNWGEQKKAMEVAIKALGLTEERTPDLEGDGYSDGHLVYDTWICPNCETHYEMEYEEHDHCPKCGQAINWKEIKGGADHGER